VTAGAQRGPGLPIEWRRREPPLAPSVVIGLGEVARALVSATLRRSDADLATLRGLAGDGLVCLVGDDLPWADGAHWLGQSPDAPGLYVPTQRRPTVHPMLLAAALGGAPPMAVLDDPPLRLPLGRARPLDRGRLLAWLAS